MIKDVSKFDAGYYTCAVHFKPPKCLVGQRLLNEATAVVVVVNKNPLIFFTCIFIVTILYVLIIVFLIFQMRKKSRKEIIASCGAFPCEARGAFPCKARGAFPFITHGESKKGSYIANPYFEPPGPFSKSFPIDTASETYQFHCLYVIHLSV